MCNEAVEIDPFTLWHVADQYKIQEMCDKAVQEDPGLLWPVPDQYKTQEICDKAVEEDPGLLENVSDWFVTEQQIGLWGDDDDYDYDGKLIEWHDRYKKRKAQKAKIMDELMPIAWHPSRWWDWCVPEDEKGGVEKLQT